MSRAKGGPRAGANARANQQLAVRVLDECLRSARGVPDVMARSPAARGVPAAVRAEVARLVQRALGARRRLQFVLGGDESSAAALLRASLADAGEPIAIDGPAVPDRAAIAERIDAIAAPELRFAVRWSLPDWAGTEFREAFGDEADAVAQALLQPPPRTLRTNLLRVASRDQLASRLAGEGVHTRPARFAATALHATSDDDLFRTRAFRDGAFEQQDEASQLAVLATAPPPGGRVLDLCCGSGGKTLALAAALQNRGTVLATDVHAGRLRELRARLPRAGADNVRPLLRDGGERAEAALREFGLRADRILIDAPCSGTGSWRRRPQARWSVDAADVDALVATQRELLLQAADLLRPRARLVYATCSLLPRENQQQVAWLRSQRPQLTPVPLKEILGGAAAAPVADASGGTLTLRPDRHGCDGFFAAVLRRSAGV